MTLEEFLEFKHLYMISSDAVKDYIDANPTDENADGDGIDEPNYFGEICRYARIVMSELREIGILFLDESTFLDDYCDLRMVAAYNRIFNSDKFLELMRACDVALLKQLLGDASAEDIYLEDWFEDLLIKIAFQYPLNEDFTIMLTHSDRVTVDNTFRDRIVKLVDHLIDERGGDLV